MAISPQQLTISLYSAHRAVIFAIAQLSCFYPGVGYTKTGTYRRLLTSAVGASLAGVRGPSLSSEKNEFGIGADAISNYSRKQSHFHLKVGLEFENFYIVELPKQLLATHPHYLYANLDELRDPCFQKVGRYVPPGLAQTPVAPPVLQRLHSCGTG